MPSMHWRNPCLVADRPNASYTSANDLETDPGCAVIDKAQFVGGCFGYVQNASLDEGASVIDAQDDTFAVSHILDPDFLAKADAAVCCGHFCRICIFSRRRF